MRRAVVTGLGCVSALGENAPSTWSNLMDGRGGIALTTVCVDGQGDLEVTAPLGGVAFDPAIRLREKFGRRAVAGVDRFANLAACATAEALGDAALSGDPSLSSAAIIYANTSGGLMTIDDSYQRLYYERSPDLHPLTVPKMMGSAAVSHLSTLFGVRGLAYSISSACASSAHAVSEGMHLIRSGRAETVIVGGSDASLTYGSLRAWSALQATSRETCRPFSKGRDGTALGEGAATLVLEELESARRRGARIYAEVAGSGACSDAGHITKPDAESAARALTAAHEDAGLALDEPLLLSAHGTATLLNDRTEAEIFRRVYGDHLSHHRVIATKSSHGHMLGATGAMEFLLAILAIHHGRAPAILNYLEDDEEISLPLVLAAEDIRARAAVSTSFAFGGLNCALVARLI
ncbi:MAG: beta-ketoacyl-[acyl-carrier-protein] synthase family protein [Rhodobacter sp.]|jgi:nodulation protein E|nr:beta-ketoacyl-[acyl-carrier-protein] synthase family protein [Rhodobacter sp.]